MKKQLLKIIAIVMPVIFLTACASSNQQQTLESKFETGQKDFIAHDYQGAFEQLEPVAREGNANAQYAIGYMYFYGKGVKEDQELGKVWIKKAARQGQPLAQKALALINQHGQKEEESKVFITKNQMANNKFQRVINQQAPILNQ